MADSSPPGRTFRGQSQEERVSQRRRQLLDAGLSQFGTRGYHAVSVRDVCTEAKLTERYFYEPFQNREALFLAVYNEGVERVRDAMVQAVAAVEREVTQVARASVRAYFATLRQEPLLARVLLFDVLTIGAEAGNRSLMATTSFGDMVAAIIEDLYPELRRHKLDPHWIGNALVGAAVFMAMQWVMSDFKDPIEHMVENCAVLVDGLVALVRAQNETRAAAEPRTSKRKPLLG